MLYIYRYKRNHFDFSAETKNCEEKVQDAEEAHKAEIIKLKVGFESFLGLEKWGKGGGWSIEQVQIIKVLYADG